MQEIIIIQADSFAKLEKINKVLEEGGKVISVTANSAKSEEEAAWLLVVDNGKPQTLKV